MFGLSWEYMLWLSSFHLGELGRMNWNTFYLHRRPVSSLCPRNLHSKVTWDFSDHVIRFIFLFVYFHSNFTEDFSQAFDWLKLVLDSCHDFLPNWREVITGANGGPVYWCIYASIGLHELTHWGREKWLLFSRRHFQMHFLEWKFMNFH